jgi:phosphoglycolate phosphatase
MTYKMIVFDWDGTLFDSSAHIVECVQHAARAIDLDTPDPQKVKSMIGLSFEEAIDRVLPNLSPVQMAKFTQTYRHHADDVNLDQPMLFEGSETVLKTLHDQGYWLAIATGKSRRGLARDLQLLALDDYFMVSRTADETRSKPHPQMLLELIDVTGVMSADVLMVGDTTFDIQMALNAEVDALAVTYGVHDKDQLQHDNVRGFLDDIRHLPDWLEQQEDVHS